MFSKGSRYRNLTESSALDADGERQRGKDLRLISTPDGSYLHMVRDGDRLDLIAHKYYGDPVKWWQISDANPQQPFPTDLLDSWPIVREHLVLEHRGFNQRFYELLAELQILLTGESDLKSVLTLEELNDFDKSELDALMQSAAVIIEPPAFFTSNVVLVNQPQTATRGDVLGKLKAKGFNLLSTDEWQAGVERTASGVKTEAGEGRVQAVAFAFDDPAVKREWQAMMDELADLTGVLQAASVSMETACDILYVSAQVTRTRLLEVIAQHGFNLTAESSTFSRIGTKFVVPPNQIV